MEEKNTRITLAHIAEQLGVSTMTVSLALRNNPRISAATREKVQQKAIELGYHPDPMLSALTHYRKSSKQKIRTATLAWINPYHDPKRLRAMVEFNLYWEGAAKAANRMGFNLEAFATTKMSFARMNTVFKTRNIQGILLAAMARPQFSDPNADYQQMPWQDYAIVRFGRSTAYPQAHYVTSAQTKNTVRAFEQIRAKGYQRVGFAGDSSKTKTFHGGASIAQEYVPAEWRIPNLLFGPTDDAPARIANLAAWLKQWKPEAVYTDNADMPDYLKTLGIRVPQDLGLATTSIHDTPIDSGMNQNPEEIGRTAVRNLVSLLNEQEYGIPPIRTEILVEGTWVDGTMLPEKK